MKAIVKAPFFDGKGLHRVGDVVEVDKVSPLVEVIDEPVKKEEKPKTTKKTSKK